MTRTLCALAVFLLLNGQLMASTQNSTTVPPSAGGLINWRIDKGASAILYKSFDEPATIQISSRAANPEVTIQVSGCAKTGVETVPLRPGSTIFVNGCQIEVLPGSVVANGTWFFLGAASRHSLPRR